MEEIIDILKLTPKDWFIVVFIILILFAIIVSLWATHKKQHNNNLIRIQQLEVRLEQFLLNDHHTVVSLMERTEKLLESVQTLLQSLVVEDVGEKDKKPTHNKK